MGSEELWEQIRIEGEALRRGILSNKNVCYSESNRKDGVGCLQGQYEDMRNQFSFLQSWNNWKEFWDCCQAIVSVLLGDWASVLFLSRCQTRLQLNPANLGPLNAMKWVEHFFFFLHASSWSPLTAAME